MNAVEQCLAEHGRSFSVAARSQQEVDFGEDWPRYDDVAAEPGEQLSCEPVALTLATVDRETIGPVSQMVRW